MLPERGIQWVKTICTANPELFKRKYNFASHVHYISQKIENDAFLIKFAFLKSDIFLEIFFVSNKKTIDLFQKYANGTTFTNKNISLK